MFTSKEDVVGWPRVGVLNMTLAKWARDDKFTHTHTSKSFPSFATHQVRFEPTWFKSLVPKS